MIRYLAVIVTPARQNCPPGRHDVSDCGPQPERTRLLGAFEDEVEAIAVIRGHLHDDVRGYVLLGNEVQSLV